VNQRRRTSAKVLYAALFVLVLPVLLVLWARATGGAVRAPACHAPRAGWAIVAGGAALIVWGWWALWRHGGGLPMNAFPPPKYVEHGPYRLVAHPIYVGFTSACVGASIATGSASGLWLVSPGVALGAAALVLGYESDDLRRRFGDARRSSPGPFFALSPATPEPPSVRDRLSALASAVLAPLVIVRFLSLDVAHRDVRTPAPIEAAAVLLLAAAPWGPRSRADLRAVEVRALLATIVVASVAFVSAIVTLHPSVLVVWSLAGVDAWWRRAPLTWRWVKWPARGAVVAAIAACADGGWRALVAVAGGIALYVAVAHGLRSWEALRRFAEAIANSWREARFGPVRVINHGAWGGLATFLCLSIAGTLLGPGHVAAVLFPALASMICAALWAQWIEGSPALSRPYGFYGGLLGVCAGALAAPLFGGNVWEVLGAFAVAGPLTQATGRMRCLVQGCCHGRPAPPDLGIRYLQPTSRVCRIANLRDVPLHPTQLYSILWNLLTEIVLVRLWLVHSPTHLVGGSFLLLNGLGRFVEEAYRGEPQTPIVGGLRLYQWAAIACALAGALVTALGAGPDAPAPVFSWPVFAAALAFGALTWFATGVDFPESNRRFSRLT
jgi:prolipoprotein diacylglyceryltransferase/protein-S-isoprenylcysteine O-methyltransferase Ste14